MQFISKNTTKYFGGWPYNPNKHKINGSNLNFTCPNNIGCECSTNNDCVNKNCLKIPRGSYCFPKKGDVFPKFISLDQYEENVDIYDFANQGKYILVELGTVWCSPCNTVANWLAYNDSSIKTEKWWKPEYNKIYDMVHNDNIYFITILYEDEKRNNATYDTVYEWFDNYPDDKIPVLVDTDKLLHTWIKPSGIPAITLLDENMNIVSFSSRGLNDSFDKILELLRDDHE